MVKSDLQLNLKAVMSK